ncbi:type II/IV secretion system protein [Ectothiorhodospiraceae bacterium BW-2]|nr:type II/IV secretion system protein [Ectothiorhodospiraceae bacterium BW-2]
MSQHPPTYLTLAWLLEALESDGLITSLQRLDLVPTGEHATHSLQTHPLITLGERQWRHAQSPTVVLTTEYLCQWLAKRAGIGYRRIDPLKIDVARVTTQVSEAYANRHHILPLQISDHELVVATAEPFQLQWVEELEPILQKSVVAVLVNPVDLNRYLHDFYHLSHSIKGAEEHQNRNRYGKLRDLEQLMELGKSGQVDTNSRHVVNIVDWLLQYAFEQRASDIHLEPRREEGIVRFRIDGQLQTVYAMPMQIVTTITSRIKILARMDVAEKRRPQDGRIKSRTRNGSEFEMRLSTMPTAFGEKLVMRIFNPQLMLKSFTELGFSVELQQQWQQLLAQQNGIILVTGPTGSGKTTTLYSSLKQLATSEINLCTVEDPIETIVNEFNQMQVAPEIGITFATGIRTLMRQDPDIIMVGEIRDQETAEMAAQAALTGHLVLSTLHTNDSVSAIIRLTDIGLPAYQIKASLRGVLAQRLLRTLCPHCKSRAQLPQGLWQSLTTPWRVKPPAEIFTAQGCHECRNTGYHGRTAIYEMLPIDELLARLITDQADLKALRLQAYKQGLQPLALSAARLLASGLTSGEEIMRILPGMALPQAAPRLAQ